MKKTVSVILVALMLAFSVITVFAANPVTADEGWKAEYADRNSADGKIIVMPGADRNDIKFRWISSNYGSAFTYTDADGSTEKATVITTITSAGITNTVSLSDLDAGVYDYTVTADGKTYGGTFTVTEEDAAFTMAYTTDAQIGRSDKNSEEAVDNDSYGWYRTVNAAVEKGAEIILSGGDEANKSSVKSQYNQFLSNDTLRNVRLACTKGNHDVTGTNYDAYFGATGNDFIGNDYFFAYGNALIIVLDSNIVSSLMHTATIASAVSAYPDATWRIVMLHHSAYSPDADETINYTNGLYLTDIFDRYDIDLALSGHDHNYSRTYALTADEKDVNGTVYMQANTASACNIHNFDASSYPKIEFSYELQEASYSLLTVTEDTITVNSYTTDSDVCFDTFTLTKGETTQTEDTTLFGRIIALFAKLISFVIANSGC